MGNKTKTAKGANTVAAKAAEKVGRGVLKENAELKEVYVTTDGTAFYERQDAQNHARTLNDREVFNIKRAELAAAEAKAEEDTESDEGAEKEEPNAEAND